MEAVRGDIENTRILQPRRSPSPVALDLALPLPAVTGDVYFEGQPAELLRSDRPGLDQQRVFIIVPI